MSSVEVAYDSLGPDDAPAIVFANSLGADMSMWEPQVEALRDRARCVVYDQRGHGRSPVPPAPYRIADLSADLVALLDRLGIERARLCGLSLGGMVAIETAATAPERVERIALCCTSADFGNPSPWLERAERVRADGVEAVADAVIERWFTPAFAAADPERHARMRHMLASTPAGGYAACCEVIAGLDLTPRLGEIEAPALVVVGENDPAAPPEMGERIAAGIDGARLESLAGARHLANVECPDEFNSLIAEHLLGEEDR